jgi:exosome complex component RRP40
MSTALPGEHVPAQHVNLKLGPGLLQLTNPSGPSSIVTTRAGQLNHSANGARWWVESNSKRVSNRWVFHAVERRTERSWQYVPAQQEAVIGIISGRAGEGWRVDIGAAHSATLDGLAFEGATKRNKPNLKVRSVVRSLHVLLNYPSSGQLSSIRSRILSTQRHGAGTRMFRRADTQGRGFRGAEGRVSCEM